MLFILLFTVASFALASSVEQVDEDDPSFLDLGNLAGVTGYILFATLSLCAIEVIFAVLRLEYLRGHIGEKRPSFSHMPAGLSKLITFTHLLWTIPFSGVVFFVRSFRPLIFLSVRCPVFVRDRRPGSREESSFPFYLRRFVPMRGIMQQSVHEGKLLFQGGL